MAEKDKFFNPAVAQTWDAPEGVSTPDMLPPPEVEMPKTYRDRLSLERRELAISKVHNAARRTLSEVTSPEGRVDIVHRGDDVPSYNFAFDTGIIPSTVFELRESGMLEEAIGLKRGEKTRLKSSNGSEVNIERFAKSNISLSYPSKEDALALRGCLQTAYDSNEIVHSATVLLERMSEGSNGDLSDTPIDLSNDPIAAAAVLSKLGLRIVDPFGGGDFADVYEKGESAIKDYLNTRISSILGGDFMMSGMSRTVSEDGESVASISWKPYDSSPLEMFLVADSPVAPNENPLSQKWRLGWSIDQSVAGKETADQAPEYMSEAFIDRPVGFSLLGALESSGLVLSADLKHFMLDEREQYRTSLDNRYGGAYTQISRTLAKIIASGNAGRMNELFDLPDDEFDPDELNKRIDSFCNAATDNSPIRLLQETIRQILHRQGMQSDIPVTDSNVQIKDGSCFDATGYYANALDFGGLNSVDFGGKPFLQKTFGAKTFMNQTPVIYRGVSLPAGSLFMQGDDGGLAFQRFTPYNFEGESEMLDAFSTEVLKGHSDADRSMKDVRSRLLAKR